MSKDLDSNQQLDSPLPKGRVLGVMTFATILTVMFLFYIDEGYYDFRWMNNPGNWIAFAAYFIPLFAIETLIYFVILKRYRGSGKLTISVAGGIVTTLTLIFVLYFALA